MVASGEMLNLELRKVLTVTVILHVLLEENLPATPKDLLNKKPRQEQEYQC
jgi:hypothetical protein